MAAARLARVHGVPHVGSGTPRTAAVAPQFDWLKAMSRLAWHATAVAAARPCLLVHASHGGVATPYPLALPMILF